MKQFQTNLIRLTFYSGLSYYICNQSVVKNVGSDKAYRYDSDLLKVLAIIAVVLYHAGWCKSGYFGVDVYFVLDGYLVVPKVMREIIEGKFHYGHFLEKKLLRLLPLVHIVSGCSLAVGYWGMLPSDYRYLFANKTRIVYYFSLRKSYLNF